MLNFGARTKKKKKKKKKLSIAYVNFKFPVKFNNNALIIPGYHPLRRSFQPF